MTFTRFIPVALSQRATRLLGGALSALALATLAACGSSKPSPAPLESLKPEASLTTVWSQRLGSVSGALTLASSQGVITTASYAQVTEPIYKRASGRWRRYRAHLEPVLPVLRPWAERFGYSLDD